ncbi:MAG: glycosyltransferase family 39 protein [Deltaproteobacteria bacterium]|nr:glycosyltransferase family 39 protein [Deltaproteobacteria bacterium]
MNAMIRGKLNIAITIAILAVFAFIAQGRTFITSKGLTFDESLYVTAGYAYLKGANLKLNNEHPPLIKYILGLPNLIAANDNYTDTNENKWRRARRFLGSEVSDRDAFIRRARYANLVLGVFLIAILFIWSYRLFGPAAAAFTAVLAAFEPNLIAHSSLATLDVGATAFFILFLYILWEWHNHLTCNWLHAVGLATGLAVCTKFSNFGLCFGVVVPTILITTYVEQGSPRGCFKIRAVLKIGLGRLVRVGVIALSVLVIIYQVHSIGEFFLGFGDQASHAGHGHGSYFFGQYGKHGWASYYLMAFLLKIPLGTLVIIILSLAFYKRGKALNWRDGGYIVGILAFMMLLFTLGRIHIGIRYVLPALALFILLAGRFGSCLDFKNAKLLTLGVLSLTLWSVQASVQTAPHYLAYFNEIVGGSNGGFRYLSDSNVDWGQDVAQLSLWSANKPTLLIADVFSNVKEFYPIDTIVAKAKQSNDALSFVKTLEPKRDLVAISATALMRPGQEELAYPVSTYTWPLITTIGHSIFIYDITDIPNAYVTLAQHFLQQAITDKYPHYNEIAKWLMLRAKARHPNNNAITAALIVMGSR